MKNFARGVMFDARLGSVADDSVRTPTRLSSVFTGDHQVSYGGLTSSNLQQNERGTYIYRYEYVYIYVRN